MEGGRIVHLTADSAALIGDLHGDLRALCRVLRECGCFRASPVGTSRRDERAAWDRLDELCSACPVGRDRQRFPEPERLHAISHRGGVREGRAVVFCGDVIDNRRPGLHGGDDGFGICAYSDSVELVVRTVARLARESPRGAVTWVLGNHDCWPLLSSCRACTQYAPHHQCADDGSYSAEFRRFLIDQLISGRAQACLVANGVFCCHGGLSGAFAVQACRHAEVVPSADVAPVDALVRSTNLAFDNMLHDIAGTPTALLDPRLEVERYQWCLAPDSILWCRPQVDPLGFDALFEPSTYDPQWRGLAEGLGRLSYCVAHTLQRDGVTIARAGNGGAAAPKLMRCDATSKLKPRSLLSVDTGQSRAFGRENRVVQVTRVSDKGQVHVTRNLV